MIYFTHILQRGTGQKGTLIVFILCLLIMEIRKSTNYNHKKSAYLQILLTYHWTERVKIHLKEKELRKY